MKVAATRDEEGDGSNFDGGRRRRGDDDRKKTKEATTTEDGNGNDDAIDYGRDDNRRQTVWQRTTEATDNSTRLPLRFTSNGKVCVAIAR